MLKINAKEVKFRKDTTTKKVLFSLPELEVENREGKVSASGKTLGFTYASTGYNIPVKVNGNIVMMKAEVRLTAKAEQEAPAEAVEL